MLAALLAPPLIRPQVRLPFRPEACPPAVVQPRAEAAASIPPAQMLARAADARDLAAARTGSPSAFESLVRRHQTPLYNFSLRMLGRPEDAADVTQETFIQLFNHLARLDEREPLPPWLFRVARNRCIDAIRRRRTVPLVHGGEDDPDDRADALADQDPLPDELAERADLQRELARAIAGLPPAYAEVVALRYAGDRSFAEIAEILQCDEGAARVRFHRAKALLRQSLRTLADVP